VVTGLYSAKEGGMGSKHEARMVRMKQRDKEILKVAQDIVADFMEHVERTEGCWLYTPINRFGYGNYYYRTGHKAHAHRIALLVFTGIYPKKGIFYACHKCDNKNCVNPKHLYWGTPKDNILDAWADPKHRTDEWRMARKYHERLTDDQIIEAWNLYWFKGMSQGDIASKLNVTSRYVAAVMRGEYRSHVTRYLDKPVKRIANYFAVGERAANAILTEDQVQAVRRLILSGGRPVDIACISSISSAHISSIEHNRSWTHLPWPDKAAVSRQEQKILRAMPAPVRNVVTVKKMHELTRDDVVGIWNAYWHDNMNQRIIAQRFGTNNCRVSMIVNRKEKVEWTAHLEISTTRRRLLPSTARPIGSGNCRTTPIQVQNIRRQIQKGVSDLNISERVGVSQSIVRLIRHNKTWQKLPWPDAD
jgi:predicted XRE-type DNA-binding protein